MTRTKLSDERSAIHVLIYPLIGWGFSMAPEYRADGSGYGYIDGHEAGGGFGDGTYYGMDYGDGIGNGRVPHWQTYSMGMYRNDGDGYGCSRFGLKDGDGYGEVDL